MRQPFNAKQPALKSVFSGVTAIVAKSGEECAESGEENPCAFLLTVFAGLTEDAVRGEASCSLFILAGISQSKVFGMLVNDPQQRVKVLVLQYISYSIHVKFAVNFSFWFQSQKTPGEVLYLHLYKIGGFHYLFVCKCYLNVSLFHIFSAVVYLLLLCCQSNWLR